MKNFSALITLFIAASMFAPADRAEEPANSRPIVFATNTTGRVQNFPAGNTPGGLASDGNDIWVVDEFDNAVTKLRRSDGVAQAR